MTATFSDGSQTATLDTEHTLATITSDPGSYQLQIDMGNMANGDVVIIREKMKVRSTGTTSLVQSSRFAHAQGSTIKVFIPRATVNEVVFTLEQTDGTGRVFPWEIVQLDA